MRVEISFPGAGNVELKAWLYLPGGIKPAPVVIMTHGFSAVKEMGLDPFAEQFCQAGLAVLVYDHRNLGASGGEPRQEINIWAQARDYRYAISWIGKHPDIDADRIALWGSSFSGGEAAVVAACDRRVKAVVLNVPFTSIGDVEYDDPDVAFNVLKSNLLDESGAGLADLPAVPMGPFSVVVPEISAAGTNETTSELPVFLDNVDAHDWFMANSKSAKRWINQVTLMNCFMTDPGFDPSLCMAHISPIPLLMVVASDDVIAETGATLKAFALAKQPKQLEMIEGHHFVDYQGEGFAQAVNVMTCFLIDSLGLRS